jgi:hypothetical protein
MSSKGTNAKQPLKQPTTITQDTPKLPPAMTHANPKFVMGKMMLTIDVLCNAGQPCIDLHKYYIHKLGQELIVSYKDRQFLVGDSVFVIPFSDLYGLFNHNALDVSLMRCFAL